MKKIFVIGAGMTDFARQNGISAHELAFTAAWTALEASAIDPLRIDSAFAAHAYQGPCFGQKALMKLGIDGIPIANVENACASGVTALKSGCNAIMAGDAEVVLILGAEKLTKEGGGFLPVVADDLDSSMGRVMPAAFAMITQMHMQRYGTSLEQISKVVVKNRRNATHNPHCRVNTETTVDEVLGSPVIADPVTRNMCCPISDGAAAVILAGEGVADKLCDHPVEISACVLNSGTRTPYGIVDVKSEMSIRAAKKAYEIAEIKPSDIDICELHDPFAIAELIHYEDLGFCKPGESGKMIDEGRTEIDGEISVSSSGGLLGRGHPVGATGVAQIAEIFWQLRGEAGRRQVKDAEIGLAHVIGGGVTKLESGACGVTILRG